MSFEKKKLMFICKKLEANFFLVGIEGFSKLFHLRCLHSNCIKNKQDTASKVFRESPGIHQYESVVAYFSNGF
jgi:hypothetical protein